MKEWKTFSCPVCGNELSASDKAVIRCKWCKRSIVPEAVHFYREASEFIPKKPIGKRNSEKITGCMPVVSQEDAEDICDTED